MSLQELYQEIIIDHSKTPKNYGELKDASHKIEAYNPLCGDKFLLTANIRDGVVREINFTGSGCSISKASASVMTESIKGKGVKEAAKIINSFIDMLKGNDTDLLRSAQIKAFAGVKNFPGRVKCANLTWHALKDMIDD